MQLPNYLIMYYEYYWLIIQRYLHKTYKCVLKYRHIAY
jgi:hypothetical protein